MSIIAHHNNGLTIGLFTNKEQTIPCELFQTSKNILCFYNKQKLSYFDLNIMKELKTYETVELKEIQLSECGHYCIGFDFKKNCHLFSSEKFICAFQNVGSVMISTTKLCLKKDKGKLFVYSIRKLSENANSEPILFENVKYYSLYGDFIVLTQMIKEGEESKFFVKIYKDEFLAELSEPKIEKIETKCDKNGNHLLLITKKYNRSGYYGDDHLYFYKNESKTITHLEIEQPVLFNDFTVNGFVVCFGNQPSEVKFFDLDCKIFKKLAKGPRNSIYINNHENFVACCGFGSMSGDVEIHESESLKLISKFKVLGASLFLWSPCGSYFCVCVTSYMQDGNLVAKYDYYGRKLEVREFEKLYAAQWVGDVENFKKLDEPESLLIEKSVLYVPPSVTYKIEPKKKPKNKKVVVTVQKPVNNKEVLITVESINNELEKLREVKAKREKNEDLDIDDYNLLLKEDWLVAKLKELEVKNKK